MCVLSPAGALLWQNTAEAAAPKVRDSASKNLNGSALERGSMWSTVRVKSPTATDQCLTQGQLGDTNLQDRFSWSQTKQYFSRANPLRSQTSGSGPPGPEGRRIMQILVCRRKPTGRTYNLHTERPQVQLGAWSLDFLAVNRANHRTTVQWLEFLFVSWRTKTNLNFWTTCG